ncbi:MAG TPA: ComF family protein [Abditibacteriaceae bacterium]|nr:ComF family protein [Abditibacteriaceae bacterium]
MKTTSEPNLSLSQLLLDAVFPPRCAGAQNGCEVWSRDLFCGSCTQTLQPITPPFCTICGAPFDFLSQTADVCDKCRANRYQAAAPFDGVRSLYFFEGAIRRAVHHFKYEGKTALSAPLAALMNSFLRQSSTRFVDIEALTHIVAVPLHGRRKRGRGYNQSELLARQLGRLTGVSFDSILVRTRPTTPQVELSIRERAINVQGAFRLKPNANIEGATILLIDDVYTTGATLRECARVLQNGGATHVYGLTLARAI